ncbi:MAG TPA: tail fiber domain-containing protein, partial [Sporolactobacillaceae bacterium]|nr:tail fiber domain-containing protein [Sporolactobacillaceae bacterium]
VHLSNQIFQENNKWLYTKNAAGTAYRTIGRGTDNTVWVNPDNQGYTTLGSTTLVSATLGDGKEFLRINTERPWSFFQVGTGASTSMAFRDTTGNKLLRFQNSGAQDIVNIDAVSTPGTSNQLQVSGGVTATSFNTSSTEEIKTDIQSFSDSALDVINNTDLYNYRLHADNRQKHNGFKNKRRYGLIIGEGYKTPKQFLAAEGDSVDLYNVITHALKAIQELSKEINELKKGVNNGTPM